MGGEGPPLNVEQELNGAVRLQPAGQSGTGVQVTHRFANPGTYTVRLTVTDDEGLTDTATVQATVPTVPALGLGDLAQRAFLVVEAEAMAGQGQGEVRVMDKTAASGKAISYWEGPGQWVEWKLTVPREGDYLLVLRYAAAAKSVRRLDLDGAVPQPNLPPLTLPATGGFAADRDDWRLLTVPGPDGKPLALHLTAGEHRLRLTQVEAGLALDYLALVSAR